MTDVGAAGRPPAGYGVLLPHFGAPASRARIVDGARLAEDLGFDGVWARDHLL